LRGRLGQVLNRAGKFADAEPYTREGYEAAKANGTSQRYAGYGIAYGWSLAMQARPDKAKLAIPVLLEADVVERSRRSPGKAELWYVADSLLRSYEQLNQRADADAWRTKRDALPAAATLTTRPAT